MAPCNLSIPGMPHLRKAIEAASSSKSRSSALCIGLIQHRLTNRNRNVSLISSRRRQRQSALRVQHRHGRSQMIAHLQLKLPLALTMLQIDRNLPLSLSWTRPRAWVERLLSMSLQSTKSRLPSTCQAYCSYPLVWLLVLRLQLLRSWRQSYHLLPPTLSLVNVSMSSDALQLFALTSCLRHGSCGSSQHHHN